MTDKIEPQFISNQPSGEDCFEGGTQKLLAQAMSRYIYQTDKSNEKIASDKVKDKEIYKISKIIGLEGAWGSGKSNVIRLLEKDADFCGKYKIFTYDAWGHQEDLQRRSILETLTGQLIKEDYLKGNVTITLRNGEPKTDTWGKQLSYLLSNKTTTFNKHMPLVSKTVVWSIVIIVLIQMCNFVVDKIFNNPFFDSYSWLLLPLAPILLAVILAYIEYKKKGDLGFLLEVTGKVTNTIDEQYTSSEEPSVNEFKNWMSGLSEYIKNNKLQKLIIVIDNMDRLPAGKVKQLWSSIYTFFAGTDYDNIWAIIPYDEKHLCNAFKEEGNKDATMNNFIRKTFSIIYRVAPPVNSDYEKLVDYYFEKAFGKREDQKLINQVYRILFKDTNPRDVISFVNQLVSLYQIWGENIKLSNMALFALRKNDIFKEKPVDNYILSNQIFDGVSALYPDRDMVRKEVAALVYGLDKIELAGQIPMKNYLNNCLTHIGGSDINKYVKEKCFVTILCDTINAQPPASVDNLVIALSKLDESVLSSQDKQLIQKKWNYLSNHKVNIGYEKQEFDFVLKKLLEKTSDRHKKLLVDDFCNRMENFADFDGSKYYTAISLLDAFLAENKLGSLCKINVIDKKVDVNVFIDYVAKAGDNYKKYKLHSDNEELVSWYCDNMANKNNNPKVVWYLKDDQEYDFSSIIKTCEKLIADNQIDEFNLCNVFYMYRILSPKNKLLPKQIATSNISEIYNKLSADNTFDKSHPGYADLCAMYLFLSKSPIKNFSEGMIPDIAKCADYYIEYNTLILNFNSRNIPINLINKYMIEKQMGVVLNIYDAAKNIKNIHDAYDVDWNVLFLQLTRWSKFLREPNEDNEYLANIEEYFLSDIFDIYLENSCSFTDKLFDCALYKMNKMASNFLININGCVADDYWSRFVMIFLGTEKLPKLNDSLTAELQVAYTALLSTDNIGIMQAEVVNKMIKYVDDDKMYEYMNDVLVNYFLKGNNATINKFKYFEPWFRKLVNEMDSGSSANFIQYFVMPVFFGDEECMKIIVENKNFYVPLIIKGKNVTNNFINNICGKANDSSYCAQLEPDLKQYIEEGEGQEEN